MALTSTQVQQLTDSIAQGISDYNTNFVSGTSAAKTTINNGLGGTSTSQTVGRVLAIGAVPDLADELSLLKPVNTSAANVAAYLSGLNLNSYYLQVCPFLDALDTAVSGLNAFLVTNSLQVNAYFANAFNFYVTNAAGLNLRTNANLPTAIATANFFPQAITDDLWDITFSGATTFSANAVGTSVSTAANGGGVAPIYIYKVNSGAAAGSAVITITYTNAAGNAATATYTTSAGTPGASGTLASGSVSTSIVGQAITGVTATGGTSLEQYRFGMKLVRGAGY